MRLANEICARGDGARPRATPPGHEGERGGGDLAGLRPRPGHRLAGQGRARAPVLARLVGPGDQDLHRHRRAAGHSRTSRRCSRSGSAPTATGPTTRRTSARASCARDYRRAERRRCSRSTTRAIDHCRPGASLAELDVLVRDGHRRDRLSRASRPIRSATGSARAPTSRRTPTRPADATIAAGMVLAIEPGVLLGRAAAGCASRTTS